MTVDPLQLLPCLAAAAAGLLLARLELRVPLGIVVAALWLTFAEAPNLALVAACATVGMAAGGAWTALSARAAGPGIPGASPAQLAALRGWLARQRTYAVATFVAAMTPLVPLRWLFLQLGAIRAPLTWPLLGVVLGRLPSVLLVALITRAVADLIALDSRSVASAAAWTLVALLLLRTLEREFDWHGWKRGQVRRRKTSRGPGWIFAAGTPGFGSPPDDGMIDGVVVDDEDRDEPERDQLPPPG